MPSKKLSPAPQAPKQTVSNRTRTQTKSCLVSNVLLTEEQKNQKATRKAKATPTKQHASKVSVIEEKKVAPKVPKTNNGIKKAPKGQAAIKRERTTPSAIIIPDVSIPPVEAAQDSGNLPHVEEFLAKNGEQLTACLRGFLETLFSAIKKRT